MRALFVGDVVGPRAVTWLAERLGSLRERHALDLVVVEAENCGADGASMSLDGVRTLLDAGADVLTAGNHGFDGPEAAAVLAVDRVVRPLNVGPDAPGRGTATVPAAGEDVRVVVLADRSALELAPPVARIAVEPYVAWAELPRGPTTIVDMHALSVMAKQSFAYAIDGEAAAVLGTHTHEPSLNMRLLPRGTALVSEVGMTGPDDGPQGMEAEGVVQRVRGDDGVLAPIRPASGAIVLGAVLLEIQGGLTRSVRRLEDA